MIKLYYSKAACSLAVHIALEELAIPYEPIAVDLRAAPSPEFLALNPMGAVPVIVMENGQPLTEVAVILQYLTDLKPEAGLAPRAGTVERLRFQETLNFIATEIHKGIGPLWHLDDVTGDAAQAELRKATVEGLGERFDILESRLSKQAFLMPSGFTAADAYLFTILSWARILKVDLGRWPSIVAYLERVKARPGVARALKAEHLVH